MSAAEKFACATCGKDLQWEMPQSIYRWDSPTDDRVFCSLEHFSKSQVPDDVKVFRPQEYDL